MFVKQGAYDFGCIARFDDVQLLYYTFYLKSRRHQICGWVFVFSPWTAATRSGLSAACARTSRAAAGTATQSFEPLNLWLRWNEFPLLYQQVPPFSRQDPWFIYIPTVLAFLFDWYIIPMVGSWYARYPHYSPLNPPVILPMTPINDKPLRARVMLDFDRRGATKTSGRGMWRTHLGAEEAPVGSPAKVTGGWMGNLGGSMGEKLGKNWVRDFGIKFCGKSRDFWGFSSKSSKPQELGLGILLVSLQQWSRGGDWHVQNHSMMILECSFQF